MPFGRTWYRRCSVSEDVFRFRYWVDTVDLGLFPKEPEAPQEPDKPVAPRWCEDAQLLLDWGAVLVERLIEDPDPKKFDWAKKELSDLYFEAYMGAEKDHRAENNLDNHPCVHQAMIMIRKRLRRLSLAKGVPELEPPPVRIIDQTDAPPPRRRGREVNGSVIGTAEDDFS